MTGRFSGRTAWARNLETPLCLLRTESGSAAVLLAGAFAVLVWVNVSASYVLFWGTKLEIRLGQPSASKTCSTGSTAA